MKLNLGCGNDYRKGFVNVDSNYGVKADIHLNLNNGLLPLKSNTVSYALLDNSLEHIARYRLLSFIDELHRVCKNGAIIDIYVPHYSGMYALKHLGHYSFYGINSFSIMEEGESFNGERYNKARFKVRKERLLFFHHNLQNAKFLSKLPLNWMFNFNKTWQLLMERFNPFGFDEIYYRLEVRK